MKHLLLLFSILSLSALTAFAQPFAYVPNFSGGNVSVVDLNTNMVATTITVGSNPFAAAANNVNQKVYVANRGSNSVSVIDANTNTVETTITVGTQPQQLGLSPDGSRLYVPNKFSNSLTVINTTDNSVVTTIANVGDEPYTATVSPDGSTVYVAADASNAITVIDAATNMISSSIATGGRLASIRINATGTKAYISSAQVNSVKVIDLTTNMVTNTITVGAAPLGLSIGGTNFDKLYVGNRFSGTISVIDLTTEMVETTIPLVGDPLGITTSADGGTIYASDFGGNTLNIIDATTNMVTGTVTVGSGPWSLGDFVLDNAPASALDFDGVDDRVVLPHANLLDNLTGDYTISTWVNIDDNTVNQPVFSASNASGVDLFLSANFTVLNGPWFLISGPQGSGSLSASEPLSTNEWHHLLVSYEAASSSLSLYVDGILVDNATTATTPSSLITTESYLGFLTSNSSATGYFSGQIDEFRITSSASDCYAVDQQATCQLADDAPNLEVYYRFNQGLAGEDNTGITELAATAGPNGTLEDFALMGESSNFVSGSPVSSSTTCGEVFEPSLTVTHGMSSSTIMDDDTTPSTDDGTDLGDVTVGEMASSTFTLTNGGTGELGITNVMSSNPLFSVSYTAPDLTVTFSPDAEGAQSSTITFEHDDCTIGPNFTFAVQGNGIIPVELMLTQTAACENAGLQTGLGGGTPTGGVYSGTGVTDDGNGMTFSFDPAAAGTGDITITYTVGNNSATGTITVSAAPMVTFSTGGLSVQVDAGVQTGLGGGIPTGGVYSGNGVTDDGNGMTYSFDPATAGEGENVITYTFTDANGCGGEQGAIITVTPATLPGERCDIAIDINNLFGQAAMVPQASETYDNYMDYDTDDTDIIPSCFAVLTNGTGTIWFSFTGDGNRYMINSANNSSNNELAGIIYSGSCDMRTELICSATIGVPNFSIDLQTEVGVEYTIMVAEATANQTESFNLEITNLTEPMVLAGDECPDAIDINSLFGQAEMVPQLSDEYDNSNYGTDAGDPAPDNVNCDLEFTRTIWFAFTGDGNRYSIKSVNEGMGVDLTAHLYSGDCMDLTQLACNDDDPTGGGTLNFGLDIQTEVGVSYLLIVDEVTGDAGTFTIEITNLGTVGVQDIRHTAFNVYPNPTNGWVQLDGFTADRIEVLDQLGRTVRTQGQAGNGVDLTGLPAGVYVLRMQAGAEVYSAKVVKE